MEYAIRLRAAVAQVRQFRRRGRRFGQKRRLAPSRPSKNHRVLLTRFRRLYLHNEEDLR